MTGGENAGGSGAEEAVMSRPSKGILAAVLILAWMVALAGPTSAQEQLIAEVTIETTSDVAYVANEAILDVVKDVLKVGEPYTDCLLYTSPSPRDGLLSRMPSSA